jgi:hypothetical protein
MILYFCKKLSFQANFLLKLKYYIKNYFYQMRAKKKIFGLIVIILISSQGMAQNHRQFSNWICGDYSICKKENSGSNILGSGQIVNLSNIDSNNYWLTESYSIDKFKKQRLLHVVLLDSGFVGVDIYFFKNGQSINPINSIKQIKLENYNKSNTSTLKFYYNRAARGFEVVNGSENIFYLDKYSMSLMCCNDFSAFYFEIIKSEKELRLLKKTE